VKGPVRVAAIALAVAAPHAGAATGAGTRGGFTATAYDDSNGVARYATRAALDIPLWDARLQLVGGATRATSADGQLDRALAGLTLRVPAGPAELAGAWAAHLGTDEEPLHEGRIALRLRPGSTVRLGVEARRRPLVEPDGLAVDDAAWHEPGPGGALDPLRVGRRGVNEFRVTAGGSPLPVTYLYADARAFAVTDGNRGWTTAAGGGLNVAGPLGLAGAIDLFLRWDAWLTGFAERRTGYFSPGFLDTHSPGAELRARAGPRLMLHANGGITRSIASDPGEGGWFAGGGLSLLAGGLEIAVRAQVREDPWYASRRAFISIGGIPKEAP
jgi:hypothetical protein